MHYRWGQCFPPINAKRKHHRNLQLVSELGNYRCFRRYLENEDESIHDVYNIFRWKSPRKRVGKISYQRNTLYICRIYLWTTLYRYIYTQKAECNKQKVCCVARKPVSFVTYPGRLGNEVVPLTSCVISSRVSLFSMVTDVCVCRLVISWLTELAKLHVMYLFPPFFFLSLFLCFLFFLPLFFF